MARFAILGLLAFFSFNCFSSNLDDAVKLYNKKQNEAALKLFLVEAEAGSGVAMGYLADMYATGSGVKKDIAESNRFAQLATNLGDPRGENSLGVSFQRGEGVPRDLNNARQLFESSAAKGFSFAQRNIGDMYLNGDGVEKDYVKARFWLEKAAAQGQPQARNNLGTIYEKGLGVGKDLALAKKYFQQAADQGDEVARKNLELLKNKLSLPRPDINTIVKCAGYLQGYIKASGNGRTNTRLAQEANDFLELAGQLPNRAPVDIKAQNLANNLSQTYFSLVSHNQNMAYLQFTQNMQNVINKECVDPIFLKRDFEH